MSNLSKLEFIALDISKEKKKLLFMNTNAKIYLDVMSLKDTKRKKYCINGRSH